MLTVRRRQCQGEKGIGILDPLDCLPWRVGERDRGIGKERGREREGQRDRVREEGRERKRERERESYSCHKPFCLPLLTALPIGRSGSVL